MLILRSGAYLNFPEIARVMVLMHHGAYEKERRKQHGTFWNIRNILEHKEHFEIRNILL